MIAAAGEVADWLILEELDWSRGLDILTRAMSALSLIKMGTPASPSEQNAIV